MSLVSQAIKLYAWKSNNVRFLAVEGEADSRMFYIQLYNTSAPIDLTNSNVKFFASKPDSTSVYCDCTIVDDIQGIVQLVLPEQMTTVSGDVDCWIQVTSADGSDLRFEGMVLEVASCGLNASAESSDDMETLREASQKVDAFTTELRNARFGEDSLGEKIEKMDRKSASNSSRIDSLVAGATEQDQNFANEVIDARTDSTGTTHSSLGEALRTTDALVRECKGDLVDQGLLLQTQSQKIDTLEADSTSLKSDLVNLKTKNGIIFSGIAKNNYKPVTSADVNVGDQITYKFSAETGKTGFIKIVNKDGTYSFDGKNQVNNGLLDYYNSFLVTSDFDYVEVATNSLVTFDFINVGFKTNLCINDKVFDAYNNIADIINGKVSIVGIEGYKISNTGRIYPSDNNVISRKIICKGVSEIKVTSSAIQSDNAFYDENDRYISSFSTSATESIAVPDNACYFILWHSKTFFPTFKVERIGKIEKLESHIYGNNLLIERTDDGIGTKGFDFSFKSGNLYKFSQLSDTTRCSLNIYNGSTCVQTIDESKIDDNGNVYFVAEHDGNRFVGYFNGTDIHFKISEITGSLENTDEYLQYQINNILDGVPQRDTVYNYNLDKIQAIKSAVAAPDYNHSTQDTTHEKAWKPLILFVTDVHDDFDAFNRALDFADKCNEVICTVSLGDITTFTTIDKSKSIELFTSHIKPVYRVLGNHEILYNTGDMETMVDRYFNTEIVSHNGETIEQGKTYWYKDLQVDNSNETKKLRLIGICEFENNSVNVAFSNTQLNWLCNTLESCDSETYVVILSHYIGHRDNSAEPYNEYFTPKLNMLPYNKYTGMELISKIIDAWMYGTTVSFTNNDTIFSHTFTGNHVNSFMGWFNGHEHSDGIWTVEDYPKQVNFNLPCTCSKWQQTGFGDLPRRQNDKTVDCITLASFDWYTHGVNLIRLGSDVTIDMRDRKYTYVKLPDQVTK